VRLFCFQADEGVAEDDLLFSSLGKEVSINFSTYPGLCKISKQNLSRWIQFSIP
jgi:hypothetical protein